MAKDFDVTIDDGGLGLALMLAPDKVRAESGRAVREKSQVVVNGVKSDMPVRHGRARASWGQWKSGDLVNPAEAIKEGASEADAIWEVSLDGLTITQGSNVPYIEALNNGHSTQMGPGFIDHWAQTGAFLLTQDLEDILGDSI